MTLPAPSFFEAGRVVELRPERNAQVAEEALRQRDLCGIRPASGDRQRVALFAIDCQVSFCHPAGSLFVPGASMDMERAASWIFANLDRLTSLHFSLDTHETHQIFHPSWWADARGRPPAPFTVIRKADVESGRWTPRREPEASAEYCRKLEESGKYVLTIWPYHGLLGSVGHAIVPGLMEAAIFHAIARDTPTSFWMKGLHALTENYSVLAPEVLHLGGRTVGHLNQPLLDALLAHDRIYVLGEAKSHCVLSTLRDLRRILEPRDPSLLRRFVILEDAMSPVPPPPLDPLPPELDFPSVADRAIQDLADAGMRVARTSDSLRG